MKTFYTKQDLERLRGIFVEQAISISSNNKPNYILLSGGIDSLTALYAFEDANVPYTAINFYVKGYESSDTKKCKLLQERGNFNIEYCEVASDWEEMKADVYLAVSMCRAIYNRIRKVKCETIYAMLQTSRHIPVGANVISGIGGDGLCAWRKTEGMIITNLGEVDEDSIAIRRDDAEFDELRYVFANYNYFNFFEGAVEDFIIGFTTKACNKKKPKGIYIYPFANYYTKYKSYSKPKSFQKASGLDVMFENIAKERGFESALQMFKEIDNEQRRGNSSR